MAKKWKEVLANPEFQKLSVPDKQAAQKEYFDTVVVPQLPSGAEDEARTAFTTEYPPADYGTSTGEALYEGAKQGATFGFGDELSAGIATGATDVSNMIGDAFYSAKDALGMTTERENKVREIYQAGRDKPSDTYKRIRNDMREKYNQAKEDKPGVALTGEILGGLLTSVIPGGALAKSGSLGKTALASAAAGGTYAAGSSEAETGMELAKDTAIGAGTGLVAGPAVKLVGAGASKLLKSISDRGVNKALKEAAPSKEVLKEVSGKIYKEIDDLGVTVTEKGMNTLKNDFNKVVTNMNFDEELHPGVKAIVRKIKSMGNNPNMSQIDNLRKFANSVVPNFQYGEGRIAREMVGKIDDFVEKLGYEKTFSSAKPTSAIAKKFKDARGMWAKQAKMDLVEDVISKAESAPNGFAKGIVTQMRGLLRNKKKMRGFSPEETKAIKSIVDGTPSATAVELMASLGFGKASKLIPGMAAAGAASAGGVPGVAGTIAVGAVGKMIAKVTSKSKADKIMTMVATGKNGDAITKAYLKAVPKNKRSSEDLAELLVSPNVDLTALEAQVANKTGLFKEGGALDTKMLRSALQEALAKASVQQGSTAVSQF